jgi:isopentenyl-diphosphate delta-isomerase
MTSAVDRKNRHISAVLSGAVNAQQVSSGFDKLRFQHCALPELNLDEIDTSTRFLGFSLRAPFLISSMTGGPARAATINHAIAVAAEHLGIALAIGSQRVALEIGANKGLDHRLRDWAPTVPLFGNLGGAQLAAPNGIDHALRCVEMVGADAIIIHLNPLQEALQAVGDRDWRGVEAALARLSARVAVPVIVKEVGFGITAPVAARLIAAGVAAIDVAGAGGTSWSAVEGQIADDPRRRRIAELFRDWGSSTVACIMSVRQAHPQVPIIASGGVKTALDAAKALRVGADLTAQGGAVLADALSGPEAVIAHFEDMITALRLCCFVTGSASLSDLKTAPLITH